MAVVLALASCSDGGGGVRVPAGARVPDVEGVVTAVDEDEVELDGDHSLDLDGDVASVSTYDLEPVPLRVGTYVHVGLNSDDRVQWIATIGLVAATSPPVVRYNGRLLEVRAGRALFEDGTALRVTDDVSLTAGFLHVEVDPSTGRIAWATAA